jgi:acylphosphatase
MATSSGHGCTDGDMAVESVAVRVTGRVQGVGFRAWTAAEARARGLSGWVRNDPDGAVRALLSGPREAVRAMLAALHEGPPMARVEGVEAAPAEAPPVPGFEVRR